MKTIHNNWRSLANDCVLIIFVSGTIGIALKFTTFFDKWVYFPSFPNIFDAVFLITSVLYLTARNIFHYGRLVKSGETIMESPVSSSRQIIGHWDLNNNLENN